MLTINVRCNWPCPYLHLVVTDLFLAEASSSFSSGHVTTDGKTTAKATSHSSSTGTHHAQGEFIYSLPVALETIG